MVYPEPSKEKEGGGSYLWFSSKNVAVAPNVFRVYSLGFRV